LGVFRMGGLRL